MKYRYIILGLIGLFIQNTLCAQDSEPIKPRILISTDIGGTDPDDNQSMAHLLMYNEQFNIEGLVSSPSFGEGSKEEILRMIDLYEQDYSKLKLHVNDLKCADSLRMLCKQGRKGRFTLKGYDEPTEGSEWIVKCARKKSNQPLWVLVWGGLEDVAQALHDAPDIEKNIRVYWIGGPNKKWCVNSYAYVVKNFPNLWMIESNASYRGFIAKANKDDEFNKNYYETYIKDCGNMGRDFIKYYKGLPKMGDTPSLLYMMDGEPNNPLGESWGGSFEPMHRSARVVFDRITTEKDTVPVYSVVEFRFKGPRINKSADEPCFTMHIDKQDWEGYYLGKGVYGIRYSPKAPAVLTYTISSSIGELNGMEGCFVVGKQWPGNVGKASYKLGKNWYTDKQDVDLFDGVWQGCKTVSKWREDVLKDWAKRWDWLR